jgi:twitching motility protein PilT
MSQDIQEMLKNLAGPNVSDLHFKIGRPPLRRINGALLPSDLPPVTEEAMTAMCMGMLGKELWTRFLEQRELDTSYSIPGFSRFRISLFYQRGSIAMVMRAITYTIPNLDALGTPPSLKEIAMSPRGLILVTGVTGSGKSSTLAAMIDHINENCPDHVITIEDPIEFIHRDKKSSVNQREIGIDTTDFATAFRAALRQDPDTILVGELRDLKTMQIALQAAETGHLVFSTVHTTDAKETIGRFIDEFPPHQHAQVRIQLATNLRAVISQRLLQNIEGTGRVLACEILVVTAAIRAAIMDGTKDKEILGLMERGAQHGMQSFDQDLMRLYREKKISKDEAISNATSPIDFQVKLSLT